MIIYGRNTVVEALNKSIVSKIYIRRGSNFYNIKFNAEVSVVEKEEFEERFGKEAQGIAAEIPEFIYRGIEHLDLSISKRVVLLDRIQDPQNFGAIIRACHCFGYNDIIVPHYNQAKVTASVFKASAGAIVYTSLYEVPNLGKTVDYLKENKYAIYAGKPKGQSIKTFEPKDRFALVIGSEGSGIKPSIEERIDTFLGIDMVGEIDSLNVSQSTGILLHSLAAI